MPATDGQLAELLSVVEATVHRSPGWRLVHRTQRRVEVIPSSIEEALPPIGASRGKAKSAWLVLVFEIQEGDAGLGLFWQALPTQDPGLRNTRLDPLLRSSTGFVHKHAGDWRKTASPAFSGERISDGWWPAGGAPSLESAAREVEERLLLWGTRVPAMTAALGGIERAAGPTTPPAKSGVEVLVPGQKYSRDQVRDALGLPRMKGGPWFTGYVEHAGEWYLFPNVGVAGRTGHDYANAWEGDRFRWYGKDEAQHDHPTIQRMTSPGAVVHLFTRQANRDPFYYHGLVRHVQIIPGKTVSVIWTGRTDADPMKAPLAEEVTAGQVYEEGAVMTVQVQVRERDPAARRACVQHHGYTCSVCGLLMRDRYGPIADGFIHVHHLSRLADADAVRAVDPVKDLRPICPNCHAVVHLRTPPLSIEEAKSLLMAPG